MRKKLFALTIALVMLVAMALPLGASANTPITITINAPTSFSLEGQVFTAYKVFDLKFNETTNAYAYTIEPAFASFTSFPQSATVTSLSEYLATLDDDSAALNELAAALFAYARTTPPPAGLISVTATATEADKVVLDVTDHGFGYYMVYGTGLYVDPEEETHSIAAVMLTNTNPTADITLKVDVPSIVKNSNPANGGSVSIGDIIDYTLDFAVPNRAGYSNYIFKVTDTMTEGLTFLPDSLVVTVGGATKTSLVDYVATTSSINGFILEFIWEAFKEYETGAPIVVAYSAMLNEKAAVRINPETNTADLEYSNNPDDFTETNKTPPDETEVFTYDFTIDKHDSRDADVKLGGAVFTLHATPSSLQITFVLEEEGSATATSVYRVATLDTLELGETLVSTLVTPESGQVYVHGLAAGTYVLTETAAPNGYKIGSAKEIVVSADVETTFAIENVPEGFEFPETGGVGRTILYVIGFTIMAGAALALIVRRRVTSR